MNPKLPVIVSADQIRRRLPELAAEIERDLPPGRAPHLVGVLKGAFVFTADLMRALRIPSSVDFLALSSYGKGTTSSGEVKLLKDLDVTIEGRDVIVVEDIVDTGLTLSYLCEVLRARRPATLRIAALLSKPSRRQVPVKIDYLGFEIPDRFVVGYGLDHAEQHRHLPDIVALDGDGA
jgi:hypoxanthine phosphoribosyltransferase